MATSTKENQAVIVQEDEYLRDKMEEYKLFLERHPDYYDDDLIVDENKSYSEPDEIAQPNRRRTNSKNETSSSHAIQGNIYLYYDGLCFGGGRGGYKSKSRTAKNLFIKYQH